MATLTGAHRAGFQAPHDALDYPSENWAPRAQQAAESSSGADTQRDSVDSLWASHGDAPAQADTTLRYGGPILAAMCAASPVLCVPDEYRYAARDVSVALNSNNSGDANDHAVSGEAATRIPLAGTSPWSLSDTGYDTRYVARAAHIDHDLRDALTKADLPADIVAQVEHLFAGRLDPAVAALPDDGIRLIYERGDSTDAVTRHPRVTAVEVRLGDRTYSALWFIAPGTTRGEYYTFDGSLLAAEPFAMPVNYERVSSPFGERMHPVSGEERFHAGVDLTAHSGAPVLSAAAGTVEFAGVRSGYGRHVVIDHGNGYTTCYAHLSAFARGLRAGMQVAEGQRIGLVGRTGVATGPHLHYEVRINERPVDPLKLTERTFTPPLTPAQQFALEQAAGAARGQLAALTDSGTRVASTRASMLF
ncbi:M23 family metallopeptidase [Paraburkholderia rhizosphaerae]|uniref:M23 family metallopeptidase n=1 Tax=Paraburkholderia rhizosphaerae TaxID=480658 RepID=UPI001066256A|nr:M23 family metallopeptidase [Paraburkholderia rhizosphaerae]